MDEDTWQEDRKIERNIEQNTQDERSTNGNYYSQFFITTIYWRKKSKLYHLASTRKFQQN